MNFYQEVYKLVKKIPRGKVSTYGQVASIISTPRAARIVGFALKNIPDYNPEHIPWQRVVNSRGMISIENLEAPKSLQAELLKKEGVKVTQDKLGNYWIDLTKYLWCPEK